MFKAVIAAALVLGFGSVAFAQHDAPAPGHEEAGHEAKAKKTTTTTVEKTEKHDKKAHGGH